MNTDSDILARYHEKLLDHPDEEDALSGHDIDNNASTGPIKVVVRQDGIGRTGGIVLGVVAGLGLGLALMAVVLMGLRDIDLRQQLSTAKTQYRDDVANIQTEYRLNLAHTMALEAEIKEHK